MFYGGLSAGGDAAAAKPRAQFQRNAQNPTVDTKVRDVASSIDLQEDIAYAAGFTGPETCK